MEKTKGIFQERTESIRQMGQTVTSLFSAVNRLDDSSSVGKAVRQTLSAQCLTCKAMLTGSELSLLAHTPLDLEGNRIVRLRQNRCAREGCESQLYKLTFQSDNAIDWEKLFSLAKSCEQPAEAEPVEEPMDAGKPVTPLRKAMPASRTLIRAGALAAVLLVAFVMHQMYFGGRIPFVREPEKFRVAISSDGDEGHADKAPVKEPAKDASARYNGGSDDK